MTAKSADKGKHSPPGAGNIYAKANEVIVKITGDDTGQTISKWWKRTADRDFSRERTTTSRLTRRFTYSMGARTSKSAMNYSTPGKALASTFRPACRIR